MEDQNNNSQNINLQNAIFKIAMLCFSKYPKYNIP